MKNSYRTVTLQLSNEQLLLIMEALVHSRRLLAPPLGSPKTGETKTYNSTVADISWAIDTIRRRSASAS